MSNIGTILLAAGASTRLGKQKQTLDFHGTCLLQKAIIEIQNSSKGELIVVLGHDALKLSKIANDVDATFVINPDWEKGMGNSLKFGLQEILEVEPELDAVIITVCDQPYMDSSHLKKMADSFLNGSKIVASCYIHALGVPVLFDKSYFDELMSISDDAGAKSIVMNHPNEIEKIALRKGEIDIDEPEDLEHLI